RRYNSVMDEQRASTSQAVNLPELHLVGYACDCPGGDTSSIKGCWDRWYKNMVAVLQSQGTWGASWGQDYGGKGGFRYLAAHQVPPGTPAPEGMEGKNVPAGRYYAWSFHGTPEQMGAEFADAFTRRLPEAGLKVIHQGVCLEKYGPDSW